MTFSLLASPTREGSNRRRRDFGRGFAVLAVLAIIAFPMLWATAAQAQAARTWITGLGDDANPCSSSAPCKTFSGALAKTAVNGEINCLDPGGFGPVTISKSVTIDCHAVMGSILQGANTGIFIGFDAFAPTDVRKTVNLRGLSIQGSDSGKVGIQISGANSAGSAVSIEDCTINGEFGDPGRGIFDLRSGGGDLYISNTTVRNVAAAGIAVAPAAIGKPINATLDNVRVYNTNAGLGAGTGARLMINRSVFSGNTIVGIEADGGSEVNINDSVLAHNGIGVQSGGTVRLSNSDISFNTTGASGSVNTYSNNRFSSNNDRGTLTAMTPANSTPSGLE